MKEMKKKILTILTGGLLTISMTLGTVVPASVPVYANDEWDDWDDWDGLWYDTDDDLETMLIVGEMLDEEARQLEAQRKKQKKEKKKLEKERKKLEKEKKEKKKAESVKVTGLLASTNGLNLVPGQSAQVGLQVVPENAANRAVTIVSSNPAVATVDIYANVTAVAPGTAIITAVTNDGGFAQQIVVNVGGGGVIR